jgi:anti-sigma B factor antagonist
LVVEHAVSNGHHTLSLSGDLDIASAATLKGRLLEASGEGTVGMTLDLSRLTFVDSTGISMIVLARKLADEHGFGLTLIPGSREIQRVFDLIGLLDVLPFRADGEDPLMDPWI